MKLHKRVLLFAMFSCLFITLACSITTVEKELGTASESTQAAAASSVPAVEDSTSAPAMLSAEPTVTATPRPTSTRAPTLTVSPTVIVKIQPTLPPIQIVDYGFSQHTTSDGAMVGVAFLVENNDPEKVFTVTDLGVFALDADGNYIGACAISIENLYPNSLLGRYIVFGVAENSIVSKVDIYLEESVEAQTPPLAQNPFTFEDIQFQPDTSSPRVTALLKNSADKQITQVLVYAIAYGGNGAIVGGGSVWVQVIPAGGQSQVVITRTSVSATPVRWELYAIVTDQSTYE